MGIEKIRWAILGTGKIAGVLAKAMKPSGEAVLYAVGSRSKQKAETFAHTLGIPKAYGSYQEVLDDPGVQVIYNSLPNHLHCEWTLKAAQAGKHILCEKPLACTVEECRRMIVMAEANNVLLMEAFMYRFHPQMRQVKELVESGAIGELRMIRSALSFGLYDLDNVRLKKALCGGAMMDVGSYCVNFSRYIAGVEPEELFAFAHFGSESEVDETVAGSLRFSRDLMAQFDCGFQTTWRSFAEVVGTEGKIDIPALWHPGGHPGKLVVVRGEDTKHVETKGADCYLLEVDHLSTCVREGKSPMLPPEDGLKNMRVIQAILRSAREHRPISPGV